MSDRVSPVQSLRFGISTVDKTVENEGLLHRAESEKKKDMADNDDETVTEAFQSSGSGIRRNDAVIADGGNDSRRVPDQTYSHFTSGNSDYFSGDFRFIPSSQLQVQSESKDKSPAHTPPPLSRREISLDSGGVPERFRQGRESLCNS